MIDIFQQPSLHIADVRIIATSVKKVDATAMTKREQNALIKSRDGNGKIKTERVEISLKNMPVLLLNGNFPDRRYGEKFLDKYLDSDMLPSSRKKYTFTFQFTNIKFSSQIMYYYDVQSEN